MFRKRLIAVMAAGIIGMAANGGSMAFAHEGNDHDAASGQAGSAEVANKGELCPVSGEEVDAKGGIAYEYKGKVYHFCCASCAADFKKDPEKYIGEHNHGHD